MVMRAIECGQPAATRVCIEKQVKPSGVEDPVKVFVGSTPVDRAFCIFGRVSAKVLDGR